MNIRSLRSSWVSGVHKLFRLRISWSSEHGAVFHPLHSGSVCILKSLKPAPVPMIGAQTSCGSPSSFRSSPGNLGRRHGSNEAWQSWMLQNITRTPLHGTGKAIIKSSRSSKSLWLPPKWDWFKASWATLGGFLGVGDGCRELPACTDLAHRMLKVQSATPLQAPLRNYKAM